MRAAVVPLLLPLVLGGCIPEEDYPYVGDGDRQWDPANAGPGGVDGDQEPYVPPDAPYSEYQGWERFRYAYGGSDAGAYQCDLNWLIDSPTPVEACDTCEFTFQVRLELDESTSYHDGTCEGLAIDQTWYYGYAHDLYGYDLGWALRGVGDELYVFAYGAFDGTTFSYIDGYIDYYYGGYGGYYPEYAGTWFSFFREGEATLQENL